MTVVIEVELESEKERMAILRSVATCDQQTIRIMANRKVESQIYGSGLRGGLRLLALGWSGIHQKKKLKIEWCPEMPILYANQGILCS